MKTLRSSSCRSSPRPLEAPRPSPRCLAIPFATLIIFKHFHSNLVQESFGRAGSLQCTQNRNSPYRLWTLGTQLCQRPHWCEHSLELIHTIQSELHTSPNLFALISSFIDLAWFGFRSCIVLPCFAPICYIPFATVTVILALRNLVTLLLSIMALCSPCSPCLTYTWPLAITGHPALLPYHYSSQFWESTCATLAGTGRHRAEIGNKQTFLGCLAGMEQLCKGLVL